MAKKQTRRSISISAAAHARATDLAKSQGVSLSQFTERALEAAMVREVEREAAATLAPYMASSPVRGITIRGQVSSVGTYDTVSVEYDEP